LDTHWQKLSFLHSKQGAPSATGKIARVAASLGMAALGIMPALTATTANAGSLEWTDFRPPYTDIGISATNAFGYTYLQAFGDLTVIPAAGVIPALHQVVVAPNGDIFASGSNAANPRVYKSTDGGLSWRQNTTAGALGGTGEVVGLAVSPKYPSDNVVLAATSDGPAGANNTVYISTDGGLTFTTDISQATLNTAAGIPPAGVGSAGIASLAISPDFERSSNSGEYAIGLQRTPGAGAASATSVIRVRKTGGGIVTTPVAITTPSGGAGGCDVGTGELTGVATTTLALEYSPKFATDGVLARLLTVTGGAAPAIGTWVQRLNGAAFPCLTNTNDKLSTGIANEGEVALPADYTDTGSAGGGYFAGIAGTGATDDVYKHTGGAWVDQDVNGTGTTTPISGLDLKGNLADGTLIASAATSSRLVFRSTNAGSSWSSKDFQGDNKAAAAAIGFGITKVSVDPTNNANVYLTTSGTKGGVMKSTNRASSWTDTGLSNLTSAPRINLPTVASPDVWFMRMAMTGNTLLSSAGVWRAGNSTSGSGLTWMRVERSDNVVEVDPAADFATSNTVYLITNVSTSGGEKILKSTDGGVNFKVSDSVPEGDKPITVGSALSATRYWVGTDDGLIWMTNDGGATWTKGNTDVGQTIRGFTRSPNFATDNTIFVRADSTSGTEEVWMSTNGGTDFTQIGTSSGAWGTGTGGNSLSVPADFATRKTIFFRPPSTSTTIDIYRYTIGSPNNWTPFGTPTGTKLGTLSCTGASNTTGSGSSATTTAIGGGTQCDWYDSTNNILRRTWYPYTVTTDNYTKLVNPNTTAASSKIGVGGAPGAETPGTEVVLEPQGTVGSFTTEVLNGGRTYVGWGCGSGGATPCTTPADATHNPSGRIVGWTDTPQYAAGTQLTSPPNNTTVATNVGQNGIPVTLTWTNIDRVQCWEVQLALDANFTQFILDGTTAEGDSLCAGAGEASNPSLTLVQSGATPPTTANVSVVQGQTYYVRVRAEEVGPNSSQDYVEPGPWSNSSQFAVASQGAPQAPQPQLPANDTTTPNLGPITLSWNNPAGTVQFEIQVLPLANDGPGIDLIIGDPAQVQTASYTIQGPVFGQGNYVMLPGATYQWRVRTTNKSGSIGITDPSWGPWSEVRTFKTPRPNAGTITDYKATQNSNGSITVSWKDQNTQMFYYEVQMSQDRNFNVDPATATAAVYWNLVHGGETNPLDSWTSPALEKGKVYFYRVRQRVQATPLGPAEPGIAWGPTQQVTAQ